MIELPTKKTPATTGNPKVFVLFSKPKTGKTSALAELDNCLIIDTENGSDYVNALKIKIQSTNELRELCSEILKAGKPYKYIALDTMTALEEMCKPMAEQLYMSTAMGKNWIVKDANGNIDPKKSQKYHVGDILNLAQGGGYMYLRKAIMTCVGWLRSACDQVILVCHLKEKLWNDNGLEMTSKDLMLTGIIKTLVAGTADTIGYMHREGKKNFITFITNDDVCCGSRIQHLSNKDIVISEFLEDGTFKTYWNDIYIPELDKTNNNN